MHVTFFDHKAVAPDSKTIWHGTLLSIFFYPPLQSICPSSFSPAQEIFFRCYSRLAITVQYESRRAISWPQISHARADGGP